MNPYPRGFPESLKTGSRILWISPHFSKILRRVASVVEKSKFFTKRLNTFCSLLSSRRDGELKKQSDVDKEELNVQWKVKIVESEDAKKRQTNRRAHTQSLSLSLPCFLF
jgi:hypothetical protein